LYLTPTESIKNQDEVVRKKILTQKSKLTYSGPSNNRIDVVFMGDGYTIREKEKHLSDMKRLQNDMFRDATFKRYLPGLV
jgi:hypothetical protein